MQLVILVCGSNELVRFVLQSDELNLDGSSIVHNQYLARIINNEMNKAGYGNWEIVGEQVTEMLKNKKKENDIIYLTLPKLCPYSGCIGL